VGIDRSGLHRRFRVRLVHEGDTIRILDLESKRRSA